MTKTLFVTVAACSAVLGSAVLPLAGCASASRRPGDPSKVRVSLATTKGEIVVDLDRAAAPVTVDNFLAHAERGDYDGTIFHRVVENFVVQGGGWVRLGRAEPQNLSERAAADKGAGRPDAPIANEWRHALASGLGNTRGTIAMAREEQPDTATREFYFNVADNARLDTAREKTGNAGYAAFGRVVRGMDVIDAIRRIPTKAVVVPGVEDGSMENLPVETVTIVRVKRVR